MRFTDRRRWAVLIRVRQELEKRIRRWRPPAGWPSHATSGASRLVGPLPVRHADWASIDLAERRRILDDADELLGGRWSVFGSSVTATVEGPDWTRHPRSGQRLPLDHFSRIPLASPQLGGDIKDVWELGRHQELVRVAQAYALTGDDRYAEYALTQLERWQAANPPDAGVHWVSVLDVAYRAVSWCWVRALSARSARWTVERLAAWTALLDYSARHIERFDSVHHSPNTHLTGEALGLLYIGATCVDLPGADRWRRRGIAMLQEEVAHQFLADGFHYERATGYHRYHVELYLHATMIATARGEDWAEAWRLPLERALFAMAAMRRPDGQWPVIGDEDGGAALPLWTGARTDCAPLLALGATVLGRPDWRAGLDAADESLAWWMGCAPGTTSTPTEPPSGLISLPEAGYFGVREADGRYVLVDAGPHGGDRTGHAHTDVGHIEFCHASRPVVVDSGAAAYTVDPMRRALDRSPDAHATVQLDGHPLALPTHSFGWARVAPTPEVEQPPGGPAWCLRLAYPIPGLAAGRHERQVLLPPTGGLLVVDFLCGTGPADVRWGWPLAQALPPVTRQGDQVTIDLWDGLVLAWSGPQAVLSVDPHNRAETYGQRIPSSRVIVHVRTGALPSAGGTYIGPADGRPTLSGDARGVVASFRGDAGRWVFRPGQPPAPVATGTIEA